MKRKTNFNDFQGVNYFMEDWEEVISIGTVPKTDKKKSKIKNKSKNKKRDSDVLEGQLSLFDFDIFQKCSVEVAPCIDPFILKTRHEIKRRKKTNPPPIQLMLF